jgi:hypothetical protein
MITDSAYYYDFLKRHALKAQVLQNCLQAFKNAKIAAARTPQNRGIGF